MTYLRLLLLLPLIHLLLLNGILILAATSHMTNDVNALDNSVPYTGNQRVYVGNGNSISISRIGKINSIVASHPLPL